MRTLDYQALLHEHRIEFITKGKNVKRGQINIRCPFCASADPSYHMGLDLESGWWACWRNSNHRGKSPVRLLVKLLNIPYWSARDLCGLGLDYVDPDGFSTVVQRLKSVGWSKDSKKDRKPIPKLTMPDDFRPISGGFATRRHVDYLVQRKFNESDVLDLAYDYNLQAVTGGYWSHRIIMPFFMDGDLVTWTGRAISGQEPRYQDLSIANSVVEPKRTLYNHDALLAGGSVLFIVEGPLDVLKLDFYGKSLGLRAVGLCTNSVTDEQQFILADAVSRFSLVCIMMDRANSMSIVDGMRLRQQMQFAGREVKVMVPPAGRKDAGECLPKEIREFAREVVHHVL